MLRKILIGLGIFLGVFISALIAAPFIFKDKIVAAVKTGINEKIDAKVNFGEIHLSAFKHFPQITVGLDSLSVVGRGDFNDVILFSVDNFDISFGLWDIIAGNYTITSVHASKPFLNIQVLSDGTANYNVTKLSAEKSTTPSTLKIKLQDYTITNGEMIVDYKPTTYQMHVQGMNHEGIGDMTLDNFDLKTKTHADSLTVTYGGTTYLRDIKADIITGINVDLLASKYTLKNANATLNDLALVLDGWISDKNKEIVMDANFKAPSNKFKDLLSILPSAYTKDFSDVKTTGSFNLSGFVKGVYDGIHKKYPAFDITTQISDASVQYPKLPKAISDINSQIQIASKTGASNDVVINIPRFHFKMDNSPFDVHCIVKTPVSDPDVDFSAKGKLNLEEVVKAFPMASIKKLKGLLDADVTLKTLESSITKKDYAKVDMHGVVALSNFATQYATYPEVNISDLHATFTPNAVNVADCIMMLGKSDLKFNGAIDNILAYFGTEKTMTGKFNVTSNNFDANEWMPKSNESLALSNEPRSRTEAHSSQLIAHSSKPFDRFNFAFNMQCNNLIYSNYKITNSTFNGNVTPNRFDITNLKTKIGESDIVANGTISGLFDWLYDNKLLTGTLNVNSNFFDLNPYMAAKTTGATTPTKAPTVATQPILIPKNIKLDINAKMNRVLYTNMDMKSLTGKIVVENQEAKLVNTSAGILGGNIALDGSYNTRDEKKPLFNMALDLKGMDFQQSFNQFNTMKILMPLGQYLNGKFNTHLNMKGDLKSDMMPDLNTISIDGVLQTLKALVVGLKSLEEVGKLLNVPALKSLEIVDTKNFIEVKNGTVTVKEFAQNIQDIGLKIAGTHSLTNEMNYTIKAHVPRKRLEGNAVGAAAGNVFNNVVKEASKYGVDIKNSAFVNVLFTLTGSMLQPKVSMKFLNGDGTAEVTDAAKAEVGAIINKAKDSVLTVVNQKVDEAKARAKVEAQRAIDSITRVANAKMNEAKNKAGDIITQQVGDKIGNEAKSKIDSVLSKAGVDQKTKDELDKMKGKLDNFNPFKKKTPPKEGGN